MPNSRQPGEAAGAFRLLAMMRGTDPPTLPAFRLPGSVRQIGMRLAWQVEDLIAWLGAMVWREREAGTFFNLAPIALSAGILAYFAAPVEPVFPAVLATAAAPLAIAARMRTRGGIFVLSCTLGLVVSGMGAAQLRTISNRSPALPSELTAPVTGVVLWRDSNAGGFARYRIRPVRIGDLDPAALPRSLQVSASARHRAFAPGESIAGLARLRSYSGALFPGGYDFGFFNWFRGVGAGGYFLGAPRRPAETFPSGIAERAALAIARLRLAVGDRIRQGIDGEAGAIAVALVTGDRSGIDPAMQERLRRTGLAHILAISGLHMALVSLSVFWLLRAVMALLPRAALYFPIRKWAAAGALSAATAYLVISGASIATQRAFIMVSIMLVAILLDRRAVTIRNVVTAALLILILAPESLLTPGFQMSFGATAALVAAYGALNRWRVERREAREPSSTVAAVLRTGAGLILGLVFTSVVAGVATAPFAAWHFHRVAPLGLLANLLAMPIVSMAVMPLALAATLAMPYGLEFLVLPALGMSIDAMTATVGWIESIDTLPADTGMMPLGFLAATALALALLTLMATPLRWAGLVPLVLVPLMLSPPVPPDIAVSGDGKAIALRNDAGRLFLPYPKRATFVTDIWLAAWSGGKAGEDEDRVGECGRDLCEVRARHDIRIVFVFSPDRIAEACQRADILVAPRLRWIRCGKRRFPGDAATPKSRLEPGLVIRRGDFERGGTLLIRFDNAAPGDSERGPPGKSERVWRQVLPLSTKKSRIAVEARWLNGPASRPWNRRSDAETGETNDDPDFQSPQRRVNTDAADLPDGPVPAPDPD